MVRGGDEETPGRRQAVCPLHLPKVHLSAHHQARPKATQPGALKPGLPDLFGQSRLFGGTKLTR